MSNINNDKAMCSSKKTNMETLSKDTTDKAARVDPDTVDHYHKILL